MMVLVFWNAQAGSKGLHAAAIPARSASAVSLIIVKSLSLKERHASGIQQDLFCAGGPWGLATVLVSVLGPMYSQQRSIEVVGLVSYASMSYNHTFPSPELGKS